MGWFDDGAKWVGGKLSAAYNTVAADVGGLLHKGATMIGIGRERVVAGVTSGVCTASSEAARNIFNTGALGTAGGGRRMTPGEIRMARSVFGSSVDYGKVRIHDANYLPACAQGKNIITPNGELYCGQHYCDDFSKMSPGMQHLFIHEMTHVWQYQNNILNPQVEAVKTLISHGGKYTDAYPYKADPKKDLLDYNFEQQADIVADNFLARQKPANQRTQEDRDREGVLRNFLNNPNYAHKSSWGEIIENGWRAVRALPLPIMP